MFSHSMRSKPPDVMACHLEWVHDNDRHSIARVTYPGRHRWVRFADVFLVGKKHGTSWEIMYAGAMFSAPQPTSFDTLEDAMRMVESIYALES